MDLTDRFGLSLSTGSAAAVASYVAGVDLLLSANVGAEAQLERAAELRQAIATLKRAARRPTTKVAKKSPAKSARRGAKKKRTRR